MISKKVLIVITDRLNQHWRSLVEANNPRAHEGASRRREDGELLGGFLVLQGEEGNRVTISYHQDMLRCVP